MQIFSKKYSASDSIGLYVTLTLTSEPRGCVIVKGPAFHKQVTISMPESRREEWKKFFIRGLNAVQNGNRWAVRLDWDNVMQFFTLQDMKTIEAFLEEIPFYIYGAPRKVTASSLDVNALYNAKLRAKHRGAI